jgi:thiamine pyrophosphate-dependent acetolactate synthase large subunit-like protein
MNLGSLATIAVVRPPNLVVIVWDNEEYATTGGQQSATAAGADLARAAEALGIQGAAMVRTSEQFDLAIDRALTKDGPWVVVAKVAESAPVARPSLDYVGIKRRFMESMRPSGVA